MLQRSIHTPAGCSGGGKQQSVDNYIDSTWKEIKNLSMTTNMYFLVIETFHSSVQNLPRLPWSFYIAVQLPCLTFTAISKSHLTPLNLLVQIHSLSLSSRSCGFFFFFFCITKVVPFFPSIHVHSVL